MTDYAVPINGTYDISASLSTYTYAANRFSCVTWMYPIHILMAYLVVFSGFLALLARVIPLLRPHHGLFGRLYLIFMLWTMASSLLIHNAGLPFPILVSFLYLLCGIAVGWIAIYIHVRHMDMTVWQRVAISVRGAVGGVGAVDVLYLRQREIEKIVSSKTFLQRLFSLKALHGFCMTLSWCQMLGRTVVTNPAKKWHGCYTYPAYKSLDGHAVFVNATDPTYMPMGEKNFLVMVTVPIVLVITLVGILCSWWGGRQAAKYREGTATQGLLDKSTAPSLNQPI